MLRLNSAATPAAQRVLQRRTAQPVRAQVSRLEGHSTSAPAPAVDHAAPTAAQMLFAWAQRAGGRVHPLLRSVECAPCGCRGVIAADDVVEAGTSTPLIAVPQELCMSSADALQVLAQQLRSGPQPLVTKDGTNTGAQDCQQSGACTTATATEAATAAAAPSQPGVQGALMQLVGWLLRGAQRPQPAPESLAQRLHQVQPPMLLALLLAHQRRLGDASAWAPYIASLPEEPPCAWYSAATRETRAWDNRQLQDAHPRPQPQHDAVAAKRPGSTPAPAPSTASPEAGAGVCGGGSHAKAAAAAAAVAAKCMAAARVFGRALGGLTATELAWAYGHVVSRAFSTGTGTGPGGDSSSSSSSFEGQSGLALLPVIDMLNHCAGASVPVLLGPDEREGHGKQPPWQQQQQQQELLQQQEEQGDGSEGSSTTGWWCVWPQKLTEWDVRSSSTVDGQGGGSNASGDDDDGGGRVLLQAGRELYISYMSSCDADSAWLSFGFVPPELRQA